MLLQCFEAVKKFRKFCQKRTTKIVKQKGVVKIESKYTADGILYSLQNRNTLYQVAGSYHQTLIIPALDMAVIIGKADLTKNQLEVLNCVYVYGLSYRETAKVLGTEHTTVSRRIKVIKEKIQEVLSETE